MKNCENCRFLNSGFYGEGLCDFFGEDVPNFADNGNDGCLLKAQEIKKAIKLRDNIRFWGTGKSLDKSGFPKFTKEDEEHNKIANREYDKYIEILMDRCEERKNKK